FSYILLYFFCSRSHDTQHTTHSHTHHLFFFFSFVDKRLTFIFFCKLNFFFFLYLINKNINIKIKIKKINFIIKTYYKKQKKTKITNKIPLLYLKIPFFLFVTQFQFFLKIKK